MVSPVQVMLGFLYSFFDGSLDFYIHHEKRCLALGQIIAYISVRPHILYSILTKKKKKDPLPVQPSPYGE